jgi:hypothetical protein
MIQVTDIPDGQKDSSLPTESLSSLLNEQAPKFRSSTHAVV